MEVPAVKMWFDQRRGVVELSDDVLGVVEQIKALDERLHIYFNEQSGEFDLVEHCLDGVERLVFSVEELDQRVIGRLFESDHWGSDLPDHRDDFKPDSEDFASQLEKIQDEAQAELENQTKDKLFDAGERLGHALGEDGQGVQASLLVEKEVPRANDAGGVRQGTHR